MPLPEPDLSIAVSGCRSGTRIACRVQPRASRTAVAGILGGALKVALTAPPVDGKANAALCEFFSELLHLPKSAVSVVSGQTGRNKIVELAGLSAGEAGKILRERFGNAGG